ncbi:DUF803 domain membrane protein [Aspergillus sclerotialis]|uniref:DUF803 domain membrane protein n=1 Tax=Aspergillus sclerotialis TaxID=2070753 RepID=A0A3A2ZN69_9EURO|nr:DUF803 domain membrane protein [Aspergillus sclerotialis]
MDTSQNRLASGLLTAFVSSAAPTPNSTPYTVPPTYHPIPSLTSETGHNDNDGHRGRMHEWSSLIGISTALAGNVLISLALNIQRYAHIRIERELACEKLKNEANWKRAQSIRRNSGPYGTVSEGVYANYIRGEGPDVDTGYRDESPGATSTQARPSMDIRDEDSDSNSLLQQSFVSDRTIRPGDKGLHNGLRRKSYLRSPYWWVGIVLMCLGEVGNFLAYGFAPASIVSPLGVVAMISNCVIAPCLLKEKFRKRDFWGVLIAIAGAVVVVLSAKSSEEKIGPDDIWHMITRWEFELYLGISAALIVGLMWASRRYGSRTILIDVGLVALFGGYTALSTKGVSSILSFTLWHIITFPVSYLLGFVLVFSALMQIHYINRALQRFDSTQVIPTQFVLFTLSVIIGSAILYRDFESYTAVRATKFVGGCLLTFLGVYFITSGRVRADDESTFSAEDEEEAIGLLADDQYRDSVDISSRRAEGKAPRPEQVPESRDEGPQSPTGSLLSHDIDHFVDGHQSPRGILSGALSSPTGSLVAESLREPSPQRSPPLPPHSLTTNPWAESQENLAYTPKSEPQIRRPMTPPAQSSDITPASAVQFRFPSAPGTEGLSPQNNGLPSTPQGPGPSSDANLAERSPARVRTPFGHNIRNSISMRFSPGPLLPALSGGFSAVVAESLRAARQAQVTVIENQNEGPVNEND